MRLPCSRGLHSRASKIARSDLLTLKIKEYRKREWSGRILKYKKMQKKKYSLSQREKRHWMNVPQC
jgi:hypothetical protein